MRIGAGISSNITATGMFPRVHRYDDGRLVVMWADAAGFLRVALFNDR